MECTSNVLMIEPALFGYNPETAVNNTFQHRPTADVQEKALQEFNDFVKILRAHKINVTVVKDTLSPATPDSIFPNNWISFHEDNSIVLYPMFAKNRRHERKETVLKRIREEFVIEEVNDLSRYEQLNLFLEGTGSMVLDRKHKIAYACLSPRTDKNLLEEFCSLKRYKPVAFQAEDENGKSIYHTNVMMCITGAQAVICKDSIPESASQNAVIASLNSSGKEIILITKEQMNSFAGNMLQLQTETGENILVMSTQAYNCLTNEQLALLSKHNKLVHSPLYHIESAGGGSARCMIAEIFNRKQNNP